MVNYVFFCHKVCLSWVTMSQAIKAWAFVASTVNGKHCTWVPPFDWEPTCMTLAVVMVIAEGCKPGSCHLSGMLALATHVGGHHTLLCMGGVNEAKHSLG